MKLAELEKRYPAIIWRAPVMVAWQDSGVMYACRVCIANQGLRKNSVWQWHKLEQAAAHIEREHMR